MNVTIGNRHRRQFSDQLKLQAIQEAIQGGLPIGRVYEKYNNPPSRS